jgi:HAE1 family hydrophobic/amphiphilic exporter-1
MTRLFVTRPTLAAVVAFLALIGGTIAAFGLREQELPNVDLPAATIIVYYSAATPAEMRDTIIRPIEDQLAGAPSLQHLQSSAQQGVALITAVFSLKSKADDDLAEVQRRLQAAMPNLPADVPEPRVVLFDPGHAPVVTLSVASASLKPGALSALLTNKVIPAIEQISGVSTVEADGLLSPSIRVEVDPAKLEKQGLTLLDITNVIAGNAVSAPGGTLTEAGRETGINIRSDLSDPASVRALPISGLGVTIGDVARVSNADQPQRIFAYVGGKPSFVLSIAKAEGTSEVDAARGVIQSIPLLEQEFPGITLHVIDDSSAYTAHALAGVARTLVEGIVLVAIVMIFFLRTWRNAVAVLIAIPASLCVTLIVMRIMNFTLDTVSLLAMTLITGILVDDSIVVLENTERHHELGQPPIDAAITGRLEIGLAAIVITLVDVVVFLPIAFLPGIVGKFLTEFAVVVVVATMSSLLVSFTITPALAGNWALRTKTRFGGLIGAFTRMFERIRDWYADRALPGALAHPWLVVFIAVVTLGGALALIPLGVVGFDFDPPQDNGEIFVQLRFAGGTPLATTIAAVRRIERTVNEISDLRSEVSLAGTAQSPTGERIFDGAVGQIDIHLRDNRTNSTDYWAGFLRTASLQAVPDGHPVVIPVTNSHSGNTQPLDYLVSAGDQDPTLYAPRVADALARTSGAANVFSSAGSQSPQLDVTFKHDRSNAGAVPAASAAGAIRAAFGGLRAAQVPTPNGPIDIVVTYPQTEQRDLARLKAVAVRTAAGTTTTVGAIADMRFVNAPRTIDRVDRHDVVHVSANTAPGFALSIVETTFAQNLAALHLPSNVTVVPNSVGTQQNLSDTVLGLGLALGLGMALVFLLMVALYDSFVAPLYIMLAVPLAVVGAIGALALAHETLNAFSLIGTVLLIGLVTKNGILLVDYANQRLAAGMDRIAAIVESARTRFRPIVMTTVAMIFGMLPLALGLDPAVTSRRGLGIVVIGGLSSSLLLTLVVIPVIYAAFGRDRQRSA